MTIKPLCYMSLGCGSCGVELNPHLVAQFQQHARTNGLPAVPKLDPSRIGGLCEDFAAPEEALTPDTVLEVGSFAAPWYDPLCPETSGCAYGFLFHTGTDLYDFTISSPRELTASQTVKARAKGCTITDGRRFGKFYIEPIATNRQSALWLADWLETKLLGQSRCCGPTMDIWLHCCDLDGKSGRRRLTDVGEINVECVEGDTFTDCGLLLEVVFTAGDMITEPDGLLCSDTPDGEVGTLCLPQCPPSTEVIDVEVQTPKQVCNGDLIRNVDGTLRFCPWDYETFDNDTCFLNVRALGADGVPEPVCCPVVFTRLDLTGAKPVLTAANPSVYQTEILDRVASGQGIDCTCQPIIQNLRLENAAYDPECEDCPSGDGSPANCAAEFGIVLDSEGVPDIGLSFPGSPLPLVKTSAAFQLLTDFYDCAGLRRPKEQHPDNQPVGDDETQFFDNLSVGVDPATGVPAWCLDSFQVVWPPSTLPDSEVCTALDGDGIFGNEAACVTSLGIPVTNGSVDLVGVFGPGPHLQGTATWNLLAQFAACTGQPVSNAGDTSVFRRTAAGVMSFCSTTFGGPGGPPVVQNRRFTYTPLGNEIILGICGDDLPEYCFPFIDVEVSGGGACVNVDFAASGAISLTYDANGEPVDLANDDLSTASFRFGPCESVSVDACPPIVPSEAVIAIDTTTGQAFPVGWEVGPSWPGETVPAQYTVNATEQGLNRNDPIISTVQREVALESTVGDCEPPCGSVSRRRPAVRESCFPECTDDEQQVIVREITGLNPAVSYLPSWTITAGADDIELMRVWLHGVPAGYQSPATNLTPYICGDTVVPPVRSLLLPAGDTLAMADDCVTITCGGQRSDAFAGWVAAGDRPLGRPRICGASTAYLVITLPCEVDLPTVSLCVEPL